VVLLRSCLKRDNNWRVIDSIFERHFNQNANGHLGLFRVAIFICQDFCGLPLTLFFGSLLTRSRIFRKQLLVSLKCSLPFLKLNSYSVILFKSSL
jgi:hypothetical protein